MWGSRKFFMSGSNAFLFLVDEGRKDPNTTFSGPSMAFCCRADGGPTLNAGLVALWFYR